MWSWVEGRQGAFAFVAAVVATLLFAYLALRSPRNSFTLLLTLMVAALAEWNFFEWLDGGRDGWAVSLGYVGVAFLPALLLHFAVSVSGLGKPGIAAVGVAYLVAVVFAALAVAAIADQDRHDYFTTGEYNDHFVACEGPVLAGALVLLGRGALRGPAETRRVLRYVLVAAAPAAVLAIHDLLQEGDQMANLGAALASVAFSGVAIRYPDIFDSLSILQRETAGLLARTLHGVVSFDGAGNAVFASEFAERLLGGRPRTLAEVDAALADLAERAGGIYLRRGDRVLRATLLPAASRIGGTTRRHLLLEDCTEEARLLAEMAQRETLASLGEASASMAHEVRNALTALGTTIDTLSREPNPDPEALKGLNVEVRRLNDSMTKCLSLARVLPLDRQGVDLHGLLLRVSKFVPAGPGVRFEAKGVAAEVYADPDLLGQVFHNLLKNAVEAGAREVRLSTRTEGAEAVVTVGNDGPPLRPDVLSRLFEPFVTGRPGGTGLGLALCRKIVAAHGGRILGRNVEGGVEFEVRLPWTS